MLDCSFAVQAEGLVILVKGDQEKKVMWIWEWGWQWSEKMYWVRGASEFEEDEAMAVMLK